MEAANVVFPYHLLFSIKMIELSLYEIQSAAQFLNWYNLWAMK